MEARAVRQVDEGNAGLRVAPGAHPAAHGDRRLLGRASAEDVAHAERLHCVEVYDFLRRRCAESLTLVCTATILPAGRAMTPSVYAKALMRAAEMLGGRDRLREFLHVPMRALDKWLDGSEEQHLDIFLKAVDVICGQLEHAQESEP